MEELEVIAFDAALLLQTLGVPMLDALDKIPRSDAEKILAARGRAMKEQAPAQAPNPQPNAKTPTFAPARDGDELFAQIAGALRQSDK